VSSDGQFALSGSWDGTRRRRDSHHRGSTRTSVGTVPPPSPPLPSPPPALTPAVQQATPPMCCPFAFSADNRQIVSGSRDKTIKLVEHRRRLQVHLRPQQYVTFSMYFVQLRIAPPKPQNPASFTYKFIIR